MVILIHYDTRRNSEHYRTDVNRLNQAPITRSLFVSALPNRGVEFIINNFELERSDLTNQQEILKTNRSRFLNPQSEQLAKINLAGEHFLN